MQIASRPAPVPATAPAMPAAATSAVATPATPASSFAAALAQAESAAPAAEVASAAAPASSLKNKGLPPLFKYADDGIITGDEMRMELNDAKADYRRRLSAAIADQGIDTSVPVKLQSDREGRIRVVGDHPDKARIEQLFVDDPALRNAYQRMASIAHMLSTVEETVAFQAAYARDPKAAVAQYSHLFNTTTELTTTQAWGADGTLELLFSTERVFKSAWG